MVILLMMMRRMVRNLVVKRPIAKEETKRSLGANVAGGVERRLLLLEVVGDEHVEGEHQAEGLGERIRFENSSILKPEGRPGEFQQGRRDPRVEK